MSKKDINKKITIKIGDLVQQKEGFKAFVPNKFPQLELFGLAQSFMIKSDQATRLMGKLDGISYLLPDLDFFIFMYIRKDATASSNIEGTRATMVDAIEAEAGIDTDLPNDVDDILRYIKALNYGLKRLEDFPLSLRFIREIHKELMEGARSTQNADPGNFRNTQNWIGGTRPDNADFVPPPVDEIKKALADIEMFMYDQSDLPPIMKAALLHSQFETIHPFLDGNGRTGRMLVTLYVAQSGLLERPLLYLSSYFIRHKETYYQRLNDCRSGDVAIWIDFFYDAVIEIAQEAIITARAITDLREKDMVKIMSLNKTASESALKVLPKLFSLPIVNITKVQEWTGFSVPGAQKVIDRLVNLGILKQRDKEKTYGRTYVYQKYMDVFSKDNS